MCNATVSRGGGGGERGRTCEIARICRRRMRKRNAAPEPRQRRIARPEKMTATVVGDTAFGLALAGLNGASF